MNPSQALSFKRPLRAHQAATFDVCAYKPEFFLAWEMGTGKTTEAIAWLRAKYNLVKDVEKTLIISPVATLYGWLNEFKANAPEKVIDACLVPYLRTRKIKYTGAEKADVIAHTDKRIIILNGEALDNDLIVAALQKFAPKIVVLDESHEFKSPKMKGSNAKKEVKSRLAKLLSISDKAQYRMAMTGTPFLNGYLDIWAQYRFLDRGGTFGTNFFIFRAKYFEDQNLRWKGQPKYFPDWQPRADTYLKLTELLKEKMSRVTKEECLDLPPLEFQTYHVEMSPEQSKAYYQMETDLLTEVQGGVCAATNALSRVGRMLQILSGHIPIEYEDTEKVLAYFKQNPRLDAARDLIRMLTPNHKVVIWAGYRANYEPIRTMLKELGLKWCELTGETKDRQLELDQFQLPEYRVMLANAQAGGVGVNGMQVASYAIYYSRNYSLGDRLQSLARTHRDGSQIHKNITCIDLLVKGTIEDDVLAALLRKENFSENVLARLQKRC